MREHTLITGSNGMIGRYVDFGIRMDKAVLDVTDLEQVRTMCKKYKPKVILHLAAATDLHRCETEPSYAYQINTVGTYHMALVAKEVGALLVFVSTTSVFDGTKEGPYIPTDTPNPVNVYGHSKYLAECAVRGILDEYLIARVTWVFGGGIEYDKKFVGNIFRQKDDKVIGVVSGKYGSPVYGKDAVEGIMLAVENGLRGIVHIANNGNPSRIDVAKEVLRIVKSNTNIEQIKESHLKTEYLTNSNDTMVSDIQMRTWQHALKEYIQTEW